MKNECRNKVKCRYEVQRRYAQTEGGKSEAGKRYRRRNNASEAQKQSDAGRAYNNRRNRKKALRRYRLTAEEYEVLHEAQRGLCLLCKRPESATYRGKPKRLSVDHCHKTGKVRGLLCRRCSTTVGLIEASGATAAMLAAFAAYLGD